MKLSLKFANINLPPRVVGSANRRMAMLLIYLRELLAGKEDPSFKELFKGDLEKHVISISNEITSSVNVLEEKLKNVHGAPDLGFALQDVRHNVNELNRLFMEFQKLQPS